MSEVDVMMVMDTMAQMFETLVKRIAALERELDDLRSCACKTWQEHTQVPRPLVRGLDESFMDMHQ